MADEAASRVDLDALGHIARFGASGMWGRYEDRLRDFGYIGADGKVTEAGRAAWREHVEQSYEDGLRRNVLPYLSKRGLAALKALYAGEEPTVEEWHALRGCNVLSAVHKGEITDFGRKLVEVAEAE